MRGKDDLQKLFAVFFGITPAYAGKRNHLPQYNANTQDHPRLCGEKSKHRRKRRRRQGSPPPMRGKESSTRSHQRNIRITPAYAGKSGYVDVGTACRRDHPRLCGEKFSGAHRRSCRCGSPPPMRGKAKHIPKEAERKRITPAYAGKSPPKTRCRRSSKDHPRLCGEKENCTKMKGCSVGSPPPMRGKEKHSTQPRAYTGITPAYAGKRTVSSTAALC